MARIKMESVLEHLRSDIRYALVAAVEEVAPDAEIDEGELFLVFKRAVARRCGTWKRVPDQYVDAG